MKKFRHGTPDDYLTFTTGYNYVEYSSYLFEKNGWVAI